MAIPLLAAYGAVTAGMAAAAAGSMIVGGMMVAGGMMTAIGAINGDKQLSKYGGLLSLAGGIGGMATGAWETAANEVAQEAANSSWSAGGQAEVAGGAGASSLENAAGVAAPMAGPDMTAGAPVLDVPPMDAGASADQWMNFDGSVQQAAAPPGLPPAATPPPEIPGAAPAQPVTSPAPAATTAAQQQAPTAPTQVTTRGSSQAGPATPPKGPTNPVSGLFDWTAANQRAAQAGSGLLQAGLGYYGQQDAVKTSIRLNEEAQARARSRMNDSVKGLSMPVYQKKGG